MVIAPRVRGFICLTAHPEGCAAHVAHQIEYVKKQGPVEGPKKVLVIGASTGFGLASRITAAFGSGASTLGVYFEKPSAPGKTGSPGWYNTAAFEKEAHQAGLYAKSINGDAYSQEIKEKTIAAIQQDLGQVDLVIYSVASPRRVHPITGVIHNSVLRPIGQTFSNKTVDFHTGNVTTVTIEPAKDEDIDNTITVMGGEDWSMWMDALLAANVLAPGVKTLAYSYIGPEVTEPVYRKGTIGRAKDHLESSAAQITAKLASIQGKAIVSVNKALVTQASSAIPVIPLYISLLYKIMKEKGLHEGCIEQMYRLFKDRLFTAGEIPVDEAGRIRIDDWEMRDDVQAEVSTLWEVATTENLAEIGDLAGYRTEFFQLFGFEWAGVDYEADTQEVVEVPGIIA